MNRIKNYSAVFAFIALSIVLPRVCSATVWYIEADGSGDFPTIQLAVDAADPGDVIQLGEGVFDDFIFYPPNGGYDIYVNVATDNLTFRGAGIGRTIVGQVNSDVHDEYAYVFRIWPPATSVRFEDLTLQHMDWPGVLVVCTANDVDLVIERCHFREAQSGIRIHNAAGIDIRDCVFSDLDDGGSFFSNAPGKFQNCRFEQVRKGLYAGGPALLTVEDCVFDGSGTGANVTGACVAMAGNAEFRNCTFSNHSRAAILMDGVQTTLYDCEITEPHNGIEFYEGLLRGSGNVIYSGTCVLEIGYETSTDFMNNQFLTSGDGLLVRVYGTWGDPRVVDLPNNWWGTDNADEIAARIHDAVDDENLLQTVNFQPFHGGPVAVDKRAWGDLKAMFR